VGYGGIGEGTCASAMGRVGRSRVQIPPHYLISTFISFFFGLPGEKPMVFGAKTSHQWGATGLANSIGSCGNGAAVAII
jgi:hypothetical protein